MPTDKNNDDEDDDGLGDEEFVQDSRQLNDFAEL